MNFITNEILKSHAVAVEMQELKTQKILQTPATLQKKTLQKKTQQKKTLQKKTRKRTTLKAIIKRETETITVRHQSPFLLLLSFFQNYFEQLLY